MKATFQQDLELEGKYLEVSLLEKKKEYERRTWQNFVNGHQDQQEITAQGLRSHRRAPWWMAGSTH